MLLSEPGKVVRCADHFQVLLALPAETADLILATPGKQVFFQKGRPSDYLFRRTAVELLRVLKPGGVLVWHVPNERGEATFSTVQFRQVVYFQSIQLRLIDTILVEKARNTPPTPVRYGDAFESMYILAKGRPKTVHILKDKPNKWAGTKTWGGLTRREVDGTLTPKGRKTIQKFGARTNVWHYGTVLPMESELFGYEPGAFTGGRKAGAPGVFESAHGGTLFLDEIGEMPFELQAKLLRALQERKVRRIGSSHEIPVDVRIVAATNRNLEKEVARRRFRVDLYYRLNILQIHMLPLREYADSAGDMAERILLRLAPESDVSDRRHLRSLLKKLGTYDWPGNMRELENIVRRYAALRPHLTRPISLDDIFVRPDIREKPLETAPSKKEQEYRNIMELFARFHGNRTLVARELGISRSTLWRKLKTLGQGNAD